MKRTKNNSEPETEENVNLEYFSGCWYEIARFDNYFERKCGDGPKGPIACYKIQNDGSIQVTNTCCLSNSNTCKKSVGKAVVLNPPENSKLQVSFIPFIKQFRSLVGCFSTRGNFWILKTVHRKKVDKQNDQYDLAYIGSPDRSYLWLLSRTDYLYPGEYEEFLNFVGNQGYDLSKLKRIREETVREEVVKY